MVEVYYKPSFFKKCRKLPLDLLDEIDQKIELFKEDPSHPFLKTHKLKGSLDGFWSFSVNYSHRIVFQYLSKTEVVLFAVGTHGLYK